MSLASDSKASGGGPLSPEEQEAARRTVTVQDGAGPGPRSDGAPESAGRTAPPRLRAVPLDERYAELCAYGLACDRW